MRRYLLDSSPLAAYLNARSWALDLITPWVRNKEATTSFLVYGEVLEYLKSFSNYQRQRESLNTLLADLTVHSLSEPIAERYADIRRALRPPQGPGLIGDIDTLIAATTMELGLTLVTADSDFQRVQGLEVMLLRA